VQPASRSAAASRTPNEAASSAAAAFVAWCPPPGRARRALRQAVPSRRLRRPRLGRGESAPPLRAGRPGAPALAARRGAPRSRQAPRRGARPSGRPRPAGCSSTRRRLLLSGSPGGRRVRWRRSGICARNPCGDGRRVGAEARRMGTRRRRLVVVDAGKAGRMLTDRDLVVRCCGGAATRTPRASPSDGDGDLVTEMPIGGRCCITRKESGAYRSRRPKGAPLGIFAANDALQLLAAARGVAQAVRAVSADLGRARCPRGRLIRC
jgi:hypothetical protein